MSHADVLIAIARNGGRLVASFEIDEHGQTVGERATRNRPSRCSACGRTGHIVTRCTGPDSPPRPKHNELAEAKRILAERSAARRR